jgi:prepilin peptidase CpaA
VSQSVLTGFIAFNFFAFLLLICWAAISDFFYFRIPNAISVTLVLLFFIALLPLDWAFSQVLSNLATAAGVLAICFLLFIRGYIGGGDAKLLTAISLWTGVEGLSALIFFMTLSGGGIAILLIVLRYFDLPTRLKKIRCLKQLHEEKKYIPYAIAIAGGVFATLNDFLVFAPLWKN